MDILKKIVNKSLIKIEDLDFLNSLLKTNLPLIDCLNLLTDKNNKHIYQEIIKRLNKSETIEEIIKDYIEDDIKDYLIPLTKMMSFKQALDISLSFYKKHKSSNDEIIKTLSYPIILALASIIGIYLFDLYGFDTILQLLQSFKIDIRIYQIIRIIIRIIVYICFICICIIGILILYFSKEKRQTYFYLLISKYLPQSLFHLYYTQEFISLFLLTINKGNKTKEALKILRSLKNKPIISLLAYHLDLKLLQGESLNEASNQIYYDDGLTKYIKIASMSNDFNQLLDNYCLMVDELLKRKSKRLTLTIQLISYLFIGIIVILIYQVLFIPMQAISGF